MSHASLTTRYRPQTFAELAGQGTLKAILARAAAEGKVAPAYLFSGTRGVGKTTIARIYAKALNCRNPVETPLGQEPCNNCEICRAITQGNCVDVLEIDGASNRGIDNVRELKESVGYAPMEARYKIFIIDEAHMLSREAFNALLKTLEEPPARVTFIMATTEPHKFPLTIISRCQHYVFKRLSDAELEGHLRKILQAENLPYEDKALQLLVRRAAGSARDAMSLLGQVLALGGEQLSESDVRAVLGLAGQEFFFELLAAIRSSDCAALSAKVREMLDQGVDVGFFLRELAQMWRNLFMLGQIGLSAGSLAELPEAEAERWHREAQGMSLSHIHACWQLTLEGQRRVLTSLEPAMALELLLFNLALFPRLVSLEQLSNFERKQAAASPAASPAPAPAAAASGPAPAAGPQPPAEKKSSSDEVAAPAALPLAAPVSAPSAPELAPPLPAAAKAEAIAPPKAENAPSKMEAEPEADWSAAPDSAPNAAPCAAEDEYFRPAPQAATSQAVQATAQTAAQTAVQTAAQSTPAPSQGTATPAARQVDYEKIREEVEALPVVQALKEKLGAKILDYGPWYK